MQFPFNGAASAPASTPPASASERIESTTSSHALREIWAAAYRSRYWIAGIFAVCIALAITAALLTTRLYQATASVEVRQEAAKVLGTEADQETSPNADTERFLQTQLDIIRSRGVAEAVAEREALFNGDAFLRSMGIEDEGTGVPTGMTPREAHRDRVLQLLRGGMTVRFTGTTRIANISFTSPDPRLSARIANAFADAYIRSNLARKAGASVYALDFLRDQLAEAQARLAKSEQAVVDYGRRTRIVDAGNAAGSGGSSDNAARPQSLITAQLVQLNQAYSTAIADRIAAQQKWNQISGLPALSTPDVLNNNAVQLLLERRADVQGQYQQQLATRREDYPTVAAAKAQLRELDRQIGALAGNIRNGVRNAYQIAQAREQQLASEIDQLKNSTLSEQNQGIELSILRREADTNRQQYEALLRRYNSLNAESGIQTNNLSIVDRANVPDRSSWPKLSLNLALALILGMLLSALFVFLREQLFNAVRTPDEVRAATGLSILGVVPSTNTPDQDIEDPKSAQSDAYGSVRTSLSLLSAEGVPSTMMFTSTQQGEGKSSACRAMALSLARLGRRVVIIDADLRRPNIHRLFGLTNRNGLSNVLSGQIDATQATRSSDNGKIDFIVAGDIPPNPTELMNSPQMTALLAELRERYDTVLVDSAPVLGLADAVVLSSLVDATVYVIESGRNPVRQLQASLSRLAQGGGAVAGAILVKFDPGRFGYGYGAEYGYSYDYAERS
ncbi:polysaccharide biosynthesis tyrosine autokinase [uncultured Sphingomonas sp.]|uniref:GumC family protein n=1 Tax=uncultured Sphingomonas sp. TaxID=158754 RepID=UPI00260DD016|nr:polysaccharide biosynthesis tyrosine autokinase [uncultured Sphingomonas sp.]